MCLTRVILRKPQAGIYPAAMYPKRVRELAMYTNKMHPRRVIIIS